MAELGPAVALADARAPGQQVVAVEGGRSHAVGVDAEQAHDARRHVAERDQSGEQHVARPCAQSPSRGPERIVEDSRDLADVEGDVGDGPADHRLLAERVDRPGDRRQLPCLVGRDRAGGAEHGGEALGPLVDAVATGEQAAGAAQAAHQLGEPTGTAHVVGGDVVEGLHPSRIGRRRDRPAAPGPRRRAAVGRCLPPRCPRRRWPRATRRGLVGVESPTGAQLVDPPPEPLEVGGREREHAAHRCERGEVEHVDGGAPAGQRGDDGAERGRHRVLRTEREVADGDRHRQPTAAEHGRRERREASDVGGHHEHVRGSSVGSATKQASRASRRASS